MGIESINDWVLRGLKVWMTSIGEENMQKEKDISKYAKYGNSKFTKEKERDKRWERNIEITLKTV